MTDEEKKAIRYEFLSDWLLMATNDEVIEKLIQNDERAKKIEKQNKIINVMSKEIEERLGTCPFDAYEYEMESCQDCQNTYAECWKMYFSKKAGE